MPEVRMCVVPADEVDCGDAARQLLAGNFERTVRLGPDGIDDGVVWFDEFGGRDMLAHDDVSEKAEAWIFGSLLELCADRLDLGVIGRDTRPHQAPRRRE